jgi:parvulin-like peptidyl-prolyl isomerase
VLAAAVVLTTAGYAAFRGLGNPSVPSDAIAVVDDVPDGTITKAEYQDALFQAVPRLGLAAVPSEKSPQFAQVKDAAISDLLLQRWIIGEAADRGITVSDSVVADKLQGIIKSQFNDNQKQFQAFLKQSHFSDADALQRVRLQILSARVQSQILPKKPPKVTQDEIEAFYNANLTQFQQPETRDFRVILNTDQAKVEQAKAALESDDSAANWKKVALQYSTDPTTKSVGGLRSAVGRNQSEPALDSAVFSASEHQLVGPIKGQSGYYLVEVEAAHPATTQPLAAATKTIEAQIPGLLQQQLATNFQTNFVNKWTTRTFCATDYTISRCSNYEPPSTCPQKLAEKVGCGASVPAIKPVQPGHAAVFLTIPPQLPQGPIQPVPEGGATPTLPGGTPIPLGPGGAPAAPPGAVPQAPPGAVPSG